MTATLRPLALVGVLGGLQLHAALAAEFAALAPRGGGATHAETPTVPEEGEAGGIPAAQAALLTACTVALLSVAVFVCAKGGKRAADDRDARIKHLRRKNARLEARVQELEDEKAGWAADRDALKKLLPGAAKLPAARACVCVCVCVVWR